MEVWDGRSPVRVDLGITRSSAGLDHEEVVRQIQATQIIVNAIPVDQIEQNRLDIADNVIAIGDNTTNITTNTTNITTNTTDISNLTIVVGINTTNIGINTTNIGINTTNIGTNTTNIGINTTNIGINATNIDTNTTDITNLTLVVDTNTTNIATNATNILENKNDLSVVLVNTGDTIIKCTPVYSHSSGFIAPAQADDPDTVKVIGFADEEIADSTSGRVQATGVIEATTVEWNAVTTDVGTITTGSTYYLSVDQPGRITKVIPTYGYNAPLGVAVSSTKLKINIERTVLL